MTASSIEVDPWTDRIGGFFERHPGFMRRLGGWESELFRERLGGTSIDRPIYIAGLARSGSTILLELLARHPEVGTHRYRDFPGVMAPLAWNWFMDRASRPRAPKERAHRDRIAITPESPEAFEEVVWMAFFPRAHDPGLSAVLDQSSSYPGFETYYRDHIRKILDLRRARRYASKGNYNVTRLGYLKKLLPDARFLVPVRDPFWHVASLMKQHRLFEAAETEDEAVLRSMRCSGHFEFGLDRRIISIGRQDEERAIKALWAEGREALGWARYWALLNGHVLEMLDRDPKLADATLIVRYEDLCERPRATMGRILSHCRLEAGSLPDVAAEVVSAPTYYRPEFNQRERDEIEAYIGEVAARLGYGSPAVAGARAGLGLPTNA